MQIKSTLLSSDLRHSISNSLEIDVQLTSGVYQQYDVLCGTINKLKPVLETMNVSEVGVGVQSLTTISTHL